MRTTLAKDHGERKRFKARFVRVGKKTNFKGYSEDTLLLQNVMDLSTGQLVADHIWFTFSKVFDEAGIREGDVIAFDARIKSYKKGYVNKALSLRTQKKDYKLSHPTRVEIVEKARG